MKRLYELSEKEIATTIKNGDLHVGVLGFGYIGSCIGASIADTGNKVVGIDLNSELVNATNRGECHIPEPGLKELVAKTVREGRLTATTDSSALKKCDFIIVTVGTPLDAKFAPDMSFIKSASDIVSRNLESGQVVLLKSTVPPFSIERIVKPILERTGLKAGFDFGLAFCPERLAEGAGLKELKTVPVIVGGINEMSTQVVSALWKSLFSVETIPVSSPSVAEMTKLADNLWIDLNIALANELAKLCDKLSIDSVEVIRAANTLPKGMSKVNILLPSTGVGGYCLTKDPWFVHHLGQEYGLELEIPKISRRVNDSMPAYTFSLVKELLEKAGKKLEKSRVAALGLSFKNDTGDLRNTPAKFTIDLLLKNGCEVRAFDPLVGKEEAKSIIPAKIVDSFEEAVTEADCIVFFTGHKQFKEVSLDYIETLVQPGCIVIDGRNSFDPAEMRKRRFTYKGIGR
jgi:UDP-N-acetyl-D-mannosaminuronic acid dehydrogenase